MIATYPESDVQDHVHTRKRVAFVAEWLSQTLVVCSAQVKVRFSQKHQNRSCRAPSSLQLCFADTKPVRTPPLFKPSQSMLLKRALKLLAPFWGT